MLPSSNDWNQYTIQDPIHGGIRYGPIEKMIIDHRLFQRLHGLRQNSLLHLVFPAANHTRFDHSVGVMHLADRFLESILKNQRTIVEKGSNRSSYEAKYRVDDQSIQQTFKQLAGDEYPKVVIRVAALLHDTGHGPFSHLFDRFFPPMSFVRELISNSRSSYDHIAEAFPGNAEADPLKHEMMSCLIATHIVNDVASELKQLNVDPSLLASDVCSVIDDRLRPSGRLSEAFPYKISHLLHEVVSSNVDADRMDYLLRDSHMCGVNYGLYDPDRILKSMCAYGDSQTNLLHIGIRYSGLGALEDLLVSRYQMHSQVYGHKTNRACAVMLDEIHDKLKASGWTWYESSRTIDDFLHTFSELSDSSLVEKIRSDNKSISEALLNKLMERKLIKRTFEERIAAPDGESHEDVGAKAEAEARWNKHKDLMKEGGIWFRGDIFDIKGLGLDGPRATLKVLRKHPQEGYYLVHELAEFSTIVKYLPAEEFIYRNYCFAPQAHAAKKLVPRNT